ncbi:MAG: OmpA family protein [Myxococcales bacterium]
MTPLSLPLSKPSRLPLLWLAALGTACASPTAVRARDEVLHHDVAEARHSGAYRCAPRELATAEANLTFSERELTDGHSMDADHFTGIAEDAIKKALDLSKTCGPKEVVIAAPPPPKPVQVVKIEAKDTDGDGIPDDIDRCPTVPGPKENFGCPWPDRDGDGVLDKDDKCPDVPGPKENNGCPWGDKDKDGVADNVDKCPDVPGPKENDGCPWPDRDGDGIPDKDDKCPDVPGIPPDGCPKKYKLVVVKQNRIEIKQQVHFATNKWRILSDSFELLNEVASVLKDSPNIRVRVEGHTDNIGSADHNMTLSQHRAESVSEYLIEHGIDPARLMSQGFGFTRPIASNATRLGRAQNRRVEFHILRADGSDVAPAPEAPPAGE